MFFSKKKKPTAPCELCKHRFGLNDLTPIKKLGPSSLEGLKLLHPHYRADGFICAADLRKIRLQLIRHLYASPEANSNALEEILLQKDETYPFSFNQEFQKELSLGERISQRVTPFIGSWGFVLIFLAFIIFWVFYNSQRELDEHFDPFPFVLLNLFLSCMAAIQAPIIMMAQSRLAKRDRLRADEDFYTTLKAELEIRQLHTKLDAFIKNQENKK